MIYVEAAAAVPRDSTLLTDEHVCPLVMMHPTTPQCLPWYWYIHTYVPDIGAGHWRPQSVDIILTRAGVS